MYYPAEAAHRQAILIQPKQKIEDFVFCLLEMERYKEAISIFETLLIEDLILATIGFSKHVHWE